MTVLYTASTDVTIMLLIQSMEMTCKFIAYSYYLSCYFMYSLVVRPDDIVMLSLMNKGYT